MARRPDIASLRKVAAVRALQADRAEDAVLRSAARRSDAERQRVDEATRLASVEQGWAGALAGSSLAMDVARSWSVAVVRQKHVLDEAQGVVDRAADEAARRTAEWNRAIAQRDVADDLVRRAAKDASRRRDEAALDEAAERHSLRRSRP